MIQGYQIPASRHRAQRLITSFWRGNQGASLVEFALIVPFLLSLMVGIVEMSNVFFVRNALGEVVRDATRRFAVGALDKAETEKFVLKKVADTINATGKVQVTETDDEGNDKDKKSGKEKRSESQAAITDVTVSLTVSLKDLLLFKDLSGGLIEIGGGSSDLTLSASMLKH